MVDIPVGAILGALRTARTRLAKRRIDRNTAELIQLALDELEPYKAQMTTTQLKVTALELVKKSLGILLLCIFVTGCARFDYLYYEPDLEQQIQDEINAREVLNEYDGLRFQSVQYIDM